MTKAMPTVFSDPDKPAKVMLPAGCYITCEGPGMHLVHGRCFYHGTSKDGTIIYGPEPNVINHHAATLTSLLLWGLTCLGVGALLATVFG